MKKKLYEILHKVVNEGLIIQLDDKSSLIASKNPDFFSDFSFLIEPIVVYTPHFFMTSLELQEFYSIQVLNKEIVEALELTEYSKPSLFWKESLFDEFKLDFYAIQDKIHNGEIEKALPITMECSKWIPNSQDRLLIILNIFKNSTNQRAYGYFSKTEGLLGLTPEVLFERNDEHIKTMALAGTQVKDQSDRALKSDTDCSLLNDQKERCEHQYVIEKIKSTLATFGEVHVGETQILELPTLRHLYTEISCNRTIKIEKTKIENDKNLIEIIHPTPALGIYSSRGFDWRWLHGLNHQDQRARFGAPFGFSTKTKSLVLVGIRNLQWNTTGSNIFSGCGIVSNSQLEKEWKELRAKRQSVKAILGLE
jgi:menaquinone-specific isochorismate synthase